MSQLTRGGLKPAQIINMQNEGSPVNCMFNPFEYSIVKQNTWQPGNVTGQDAPRFTFQQGGARTITLNLYFDSLFEKKNVTTYTKPLWDMMKVDDQLRESETNKSIPPDVKFKWGAFEFRAIITSMTEAFSLFLPDGTPVRCKVTIALQERIPETAVPGQTPGADSAANTPAPAAAQDGQRPDNMSSPDNMRATMSANGIDNPLNIPTGTPIG